MMVASSVGIAEHRNMPLDDALNLVARSFEKYIQAEKEKVVSQNATPTAAGAAVEPAATPRDISYLLNLLADNRPLTADELTKVIVHLTDRRDRLLELEGMLCLCMCVFASKNNQIIVKMEQLERKSWDVII
jgi:hypothetical protein